MIGEEETGGEGMGMIGGKGGIESVDIVAAQEERRERTRAVDKC